MNAAQALLMPVLLPLAAAFFVPIAARVSPVFGRVFASAGALAGLVASLFLADMVVHGGPVVTAMGGFQAPVGIVFTADKLAVLFLVLLYLSLLVFWPKGRHGGVRADVMMLLLAAGGSGLLLSGDLFNLFVFYEIVAIASYGLASSSGSKGGYAASLRYLILSALGSAILLLGIAIIYALTGTLNLADLTAVPYDGLNSLAGKSAFFFLVIGFGVKAELFPVNTWVPEVYNHAPSRVSAVLAGIVSKLAILVILRLLILMYAGVQVGGLLLTLGIAGVLVGELAAFRSRSLSKMLAFSSIAQLGLIAIAFSLSNWMGNSLGIVAGVALALHHALIKPVMFSLAGNWPDRISDLKGAAKSAPIACAAFVLLALSLLGVPPLPGFWAKYLLMVGLFGGATNVSIAVAILILLVVVVEGAYLFNLVRTMYGGARDERLKVEWGDTARIVGAAVILLAVIVTLMPVSNALLRTSQEARDRGAYVARVLHNVEARE